MRFRLAYQKTKRAIHLVATQEPHIYEVNVSSARTPISVNSRPVCIQTGRDEYSRAVCVWFVRVIYDLRLADFVFFFVPFSVPFSSLLCPFSSFFCSVFLPFLFFFELVSKKYETDCRGYEMTCGGMNWYPNGMKWQLQVWNDMFWYEMISGYDHIPYGMN